LPTDSLVSISAPAGFKLALISERARRRDCGSPESPRVEYSPAKAYANGRAIQEQAVPDPNRSHPRCRSMNGNVWSGRSLRLQARACTPAIPHIPAVRPTPAIRPFELFGVVRRNVSSGRRAVVGETAANRRIGGVPARRPGSPDSARSGSLHLPLDSLSTRGQSREASAAFRGLRPGTSDKICYQ
jgi:hypothetical protein